MNGDAALANSVVRCVNPDDCTVETIHGEGTHQILPVITHDPPTDLLAGDTTLSDAAQDGISALVGATVGIGMVPSQSVKISMARRTEVSVVSNGSIDVQRTPFYAGETTLHPCHGLPTTSRLSAAITPLLSDFVGPDCADIVRLQVVRDSPILTKSVSVGRSRHLADFLHSPIRTIPINEFPIDGRQPIDLGIRNIGETVSYPLRSGAISP
jgi:hypothetical protein